MRCYVPRYRKENIFNIWKELPIRDEVIDRVHPLGVDDNKLLVTTSFKFEWRIDGGDKERDENVDVDTDMEDIIHMKECAGQVLLDVDEINDELDKEDNEYQEEKKLINSR